MDPVFIEYQYENVDNSMTIKVIWTAPYDNSAPITGYEIMIYGYPGAATDTFVERDYSITEECDGLIDPVLSQLYCYVQVTTLRVEPFVLEFGENINVIARAKNIYGWGEYSQWNLYDSELPIRV
jgi:hypothetical protein